MSKSREQVIKEQRIVRLRRSGVSPTRIAEMFDMTDRRVRQICASWRDVPSVSVDHIEVDASAVRRTIERLELLIEEQLVLADRTGSDMVRLGALRDARDTVGQVLALKAQAGLVPPARVANVEHEAMSLVRGLVDELRRHGADEKLLRAVLDVSERSPLIEGEAVAA